MSTTSTVSCAPAGTPVSRPTPANRSSAPASGLPDAARTPRRRAAAGRRRCSSRRRPCRRLAPRSRSACACARIARDPGRALRRHVDPGRHVVGRGRWAARPAPAPGTAARRARPARRARRPARPRPVTVKYSFARRPAAADRGRRGELVGAHVVRVAVAAVVGVGDEHLRADLVDDLQQLRDLVAERLGRGERARVQLRRQSRPGCRARRAPCRCPASARPAEEAVVRSRRAPRSAPASSPIR